MKVRLALVTGAAAVVLASLGVVSGRVLADEDGDDQKVETRVVIRSGGGRLGVSIGETAAEPRGATVRSVAEGSAAEKAGIKPDDVIVRFDGEAVRSASQLARLVGETPAGRAVAIQVSRAGAIQKLTATLAEDGPRRFTFHGADGPHAGWEFEGPELPVPPAPPGAPGAPRAPHAPRMFSWNGDNLGVFALHGFGPRKLGIQYMELGEQLAAYFRVSGKSGVLVTSVEEAGPAAKGGLKAGDVIVKLAGEAIADGDDLRDALTDAEGGSEVAVTVQRDGKPVELKVTLAKPQERTKRREARGVSL